jgi:hypothetical protein
MQTVSKILELRSPKGSVGVEIEVEGRNLKHTATTFWKFERDGSLRGGFPENACEYVLKDPIVPSKIPAALKELSDSLKESELNFSIRTSVHVHINICNLTEPQLTNMIYTYLLLEDLFLAYCGKERQGNRFCLRARDAEGVFIVLKKMIDGGVKSLQGRDGFREQRYSALNLQSIWSYGSLEFRGMRGTLDCQVLQNWIDALLSLRDFACKFENAKAIHNHLIDLGEEEFALDVLGKDLLKAFYYKNLQQDIRYNYSITLDIPHLVASKSTKKVVEEDSAVRILRQNRLIINPPIWRGDDEWFNARPVEVA